MTKLNCFLLLLFITFCGCSHTKTQSYRNAEEKMKLSFTIFPEGNNQYSIMWKDTLGYSEGYTEGSMSFIKRPREIWCVITSLNNDTLGYYQGLSTAQTFTYFNSTDSIVNLNFMIGLNIFSDKLDSDTLDSDYEKLLNSPIKFKALNININEYLNNEREIILE